MSADAATIKARSNRSKEYKEECRQLLERVVALQLKVYKAPDLYTQEVLKVIDHFKQVNDPPIIGIRNRKGKPWRQQPEVRHRFIVPFKSGHFLQDRHGLLYRGPHGAHQ